MQWATSLCSEVTLFYSCCSTFILTGFTPAVTVMNAVLLLQGCTQTTCCWAAAATAALYRHEDEIQVCRKWKSPSERWEDLFFLSFLDKQSRFIQSGQVQNDSIISTAAQLSSCFVELLVSWIELASRWLFHRKGRDIQSLQASGCKWRVSACFVFSGFTVIFLEINK